MSYHHTVSGLSSVNSIKQYDYDMHIQDYYWSKIKVVGPLVNYEYQATIGDYDLDCKVGYGYTVGEAKADLMEKVGW